MRSLAASIALPASVMAIACGAAQFPAGAQTNVLSLEHVDCGACGDKLATELRAKPGVYKASFDKRRAELTVVAAPSFDPLGAARAIATASKEEYSIVPGAGHGRYVAWANTPQGADVQTVVQEGRDLPNLEAVVVRSKVTVVDFSAVWCEPCRTLDAHMMELVSSRSDLAYRKLDVGDWDTPLAQRYLKTVKELPYAIVYDKAGNKVDAISGLDIARLDAAIAKGTK